MRDVKDSVAVQLLGRVTDPVSGALWHPGETVQFSRRVATDLVERGLAQWYVTVEGPPVDKMVAPQQATRKVGRPRRDAVNL